MDCETKLAEKQDFNRMLMQRILYQLEAQGLFKAQGKTVDETDASIKRAVEIGVQILQNDEH